jgi:hypothetical protein
MNPPKTLVIGSTKHQHVTCVEWAEAPSVNIVDFDCVVVNVHSLRPEILATLFGQSYQLRMSLCRLWASGGDIIVLGCRIGGIDGNSRATINNYFWCPTNVRVVTEAGNTIERLIDEFKGYLAKLTRWHFYYHIGAACLTRELVEIFGEPSAGAKYQQYDQVFVRNRYGRMLAGTVHFEVGYRNSDNVRKTGRLVLLPHLEDTDDRQAVNLALEDLLSLPQTSLPPEWADAIAMPLVGQIKSDIDRGRDETARLENEINSMLTQIGELEEFKKLLYVGGKKARVYLRSVFGEMWRAHHPGQVLR